MLLDFETITMSALMVIMTILCIVTLVKTDIR